VDELMAESREEKDVAQQAFDDEALLTVARRRFALAEEWESAQRIRMRDALRFRAGNQWPEEVMKQRMLERRPCLTINRTQSFINQIVNEQRQQPPAIKVSPVDSGADVEVARIEQGLIRHIETVSDAEEAYMTAFRECVTHGKGFFRVLIDYATPFGFEQELKIGRIHDTFSVYIDPSARARDYSDMHWAFITQVVDRDTFHGLYPQVNPSTMDQWSSVGDGWIMRDAVRLAEYFFVDQQALDIALLESGEVIPLIEWSEEQGKIIQKRRTLIPIVHWCKVNGRQVLERTEWPGRWIPIVPILGPETVVDGRIQYSGLVDLLADAQRMYNFWVTSGTETIAMAPRAPWLVDPAQISGYEKIWSTANTVNHPYLPYTPRSMNGEPVPPPQRQVYEPPVQAISQFMMFAADDMKSTSGIYDASLGARSNETSGKAIAFRQHQGNTANYHFAAALGVALKHCGRILIECIPKIYDQPRVVRIIGEDQSQQVVQINEPHQDEAGIERLYDFSTGSYDVVVDMGPSFQTRRQETVDAMAQLAQAYPPLMQNAADILFKAMDWPGADELARRFKKMLPPQLTEDSDKPEDVIPQLQAQLQQAGQQMEALNAYAQQAEQQMQQLGQRNTELEMAARDKQAEVTMKMESMVQDQRSQAEQLAVKNREMQLREDEFVLKLATMPPEQQRAAIELMGILRGSDAKESMRSLIGEADMAEQSYQE
jgi:hypothetical protein